MRCPLCSVPMRQVNRRGVEIDVCPECRGVWLDGGEMEKLLTVGETWESEYRSERDDRYDKHREQGHRPKKKRGFLGEVFDIFD